MRKYLYAVAGLIAFSGAINIPAAAADTPAPANDVTAHSWNGGQACWVTTDAGTSCYPTEAAMDVAIAATVAELPVDQESIQSTCSTVLKLYDGTGYNPAVLALGTRGTWINLGSYGFAARTSSYIVGSCNAAFKDANSTVYPGYTGAGAAAPNMTSGWDNRITSVYIY